MKAARGPDGKLNREKMREVREQIMPLQEEQMALMKKLDAAIMAVLTPDQKLKWRVLELYNAMTGRMRRLELTESQQTKIRSLCTDACKKLVSLPDDSRKEQSVIIKGLREAVRACLTDEQKAKLKAPPKRRTGSAPKKERPKEERPDQPRYKKRSKKEI
jgi:Spy/CpxP family protein refolding chaperone